ncbi:prepilin-type N-terminal cleavage/methylation domain-containing protein, partial [Candidatus Saccharibacteria bacterium]|nr:prepilin-type N-terminal cleavage/methylation domain-containing protein [Candidatus Saccharibacteria bacterium]
MSRSYKRINGFTIVELLIVVVVIAILAAITLVSYNGITGQA